LFYYRWTSLCWRTFPFTNTFRVFIAKAFWVLSNISAVSNEMIRCHSFPSSCWCIALHLLICMCLAIFASLVLRCLMLMNNLFNVC
jgi:hypothetical protein